MITQPRWGVFGQPYGSFEGKSILCALLVTSTFKLAAPYPANQTVSLLPSPRFSDGEAPTLTIAATRSMDGTLRTYVKTKNGRRKLTWSFLLTRHKALELREFVRVYFASDVEATDHNNRRWVGNFTNNPFEFVGEGRANPAPDTLARGEYTTVQLEFEGIEQ